MVSPTPFYLLCQATCLGQVYSCQFIHCHASISAGHPLSQKPKPLNNRLLLICKAKSGLLRASHESALPCHFPTLFHTNRPLQPSQFAHCRASKSHHVHPPSTPWLTSFPPKCSKPQSPDHSLPSKLKSQFLLMPSLARRSSPDKCFLSLVFILIVHQPSLNEELSEGFS